MLTAKITCKVKWYINVTGSWKKYDCGTFQELSRFLRSPDFHFGHISGKGFYTVGLTSD